MTVSVTGNEPYFPYGKEVTVLTQELLGQDQYGNDVWQPTSVVVPGAAVWPTMSTENDELRDTVVTGLTVLLPPGVSVRPTDKMLVGGQTYEVDGQPLDWSHNPFTSSRAGVEVRLRLVTG